MGRLSAALLLAVLPGLVLPRAGAALDLSADTVLVWASSTGGLAGSRVVVDLYLSGPGGEDTSLARLEGAVRFDASLVLPERVEPGSPSIRLRTEQGSGGVSFEAEPADADGLLPTAVLLSITFTLSGSPGTTTPLVVEIDEAVVPGDPPSPPVVRTGDGEVRIY